MTSGMVLGRFRLIEKVDACQAAASYSAVNGEFNAWIEVLDEKVAPTAIQRLKDQRTVLSKVKRARAPELIEFGEDASRTFVAVRRQPGETLASRIRRGGLGAIETLDLLIELADALAETHALGIAHGGLSEKTIYFAAGDGPHEQIEILGFGLAGLSAGVSDQPTPQDDLRALGQLGYRCLTGPDEDSGEPPAKVLEKQPHLAKEARQLVLRLLEGDQVESAQSLLEMARAARLTATTDIFPVRPTHKFGAKIEVVLRTTVEAASAQEDDATPLPETGATLDERPRPGSPSHPLGSTAPPPQRRLSPIDGKMLFIVGAILILLIVGLWLVTTSGASSADVVVESIAPE